MNADIDVSIIAPKMIYEAERRRDERLKDVYYRTLCEKGLSKKARKSIKTAIFAQELNKVLEERLNGH